MGEWDIWKQKSRMPIACLCTPLRHACAKAAILVLLGRKQPLHILVVYHSTPLSLDNCRNMCTQRRGGMVYRWCRSCTTHASSLLNNTRSDQPSALLIQSPARTTVTQKPRSVCSYRAAFHFLSDRDERIW